MPHAFPVFSCLPRVDDFLRGEFLAPKRFVRLAQNPLHALARHAEAHAVVGLWSYFSGGEAVLYSLSFGRQVFRLIAFIDDNGFQVGA